MELKKYYDSDIVWNIQLDTYQREIERYGINTISYSEDLFFHESNMVLSFLNLVKDDEIRWLFSLKAIDNHLINFGYSLPEKLKILERLKIGYRSEFGKSKSLNKEINDRCRLNQKKIEEILNEKKLDYSPIINGILNQTNELTNPIINEVKKVHENKELQVGFNNLNMSYIHVLMNRLFKTKNRIHEMVCYDFIYIYYRSKIMRLRYRNK